MTKDQYINIRNQSEIPLSIWFEYYRERGGIITDITEFDKLFTKSIIETPIYITNGKPRQVTLTTALNNFYKYYNTKFELDK